jgi:WD40 repeat protein
MKKYPVFLFVLLPLLASCKKDNPAEPVRTNPQVHIVSPTSTTILQDTVLVQVEATDDKEVTLVEIYIDSNVPQGGSLPSVPYKYFWDVRSLADSSVHTIYAKAYDGDGNVATSQVLTLAVFKFTPSDLSATVFSDTLVRLSWRDNSKKETGYEVERKLNNSVFVLLKSLPANTTSTDIEDACKVNDMISFRVRAVTSEDKSKYSNVATVCLTFPAPDNFSITSISETEINLSWRDNSTFENAFLIERATPNNSFVEVGRVGENCTTWKDSSLSPSQIYQYRLKALSRFNQSPFSKEIKISYLIADGELRLTLQVSQDIVGFVSTVAISPDGNTIATGSGDGKVKLWQVSDGSNLRTLSGHKNGVNIVVFHPSGQTLVSGGNDDTIRVWRVIDGVLLTSIAGGGSVYGLAFSKDGNFLASGSSERNVRIWKTSDYSLVRSLSGHTGYVQTVAINNDATILASGGCGALDYTIRLWRMDDGSPIRVLSSAGDILSLAFSPDGVMLASALRLERQMNIWNVSDGTLLKVIQDGHECVVYSPDGRTIVSGIGNWPYVVKLWRASDGQLLKTLSYHTNGVSSVAFSPDGKTLVSGSGDKTAKVWSMSKLWTIE